MENVSRNLLGLSDNEDVQELDNSSDSIKEIDNSLHTYSFNSHKTMLIPHTSTSEKVSIYLGEGITPVSIVQELRLVNYTLMFLSDPENIYFCVVCYATTKTSKSD